MLTARNEFETIPVYTHIAGNHSQNHTHTQRETVIQMLEAVETVVRAQPDTWVELAKCHDHNLDALIEIQEEMAEILNEEAPLPPCCTIQKQNNEWSVVPLIDEAIEQLERFTRIPEKHSDDIILVIFGLNPTIISLYQWVWQKQKYIEAWSVI